MKTLVLISFVMCTLLGVTQSAFAIACNNKPEIKSFIEQMVLQYHFDNHKLNQLFKHFKPDQKVLHSINAPFESKSWDEYHDFFVTKDRVQQGVHYWQRHASALRYAEKTYGVPASIIVAIVGIESRYGSFQPKYYAFNALTTLSFYYPLRANYFREELVAYLLLTRELHLNPKTVRSSYAGALGLPQFMPSSYRKLVVAYRHAGLGDIMHDNDDVIVSIANFLHCKGWRAKEPVAVKAQVLGDHYRYVLFAKQEPKRTLVELKGYNVTAEKKFNQNYPAALLRIDRCCGYENWIVFHNFAVMMHYNTSPYYCMVVSQLAQRIKFAKSIREFGK